MWCTCGDMSELMYLIREEVYQCLRWFLFIPRKISNPPPKHLLVAGTLKSEFFYGFHLRVLCIDISISDDIFPHISVELINCECSLLCITPPKRYYHLRFFFNLPGLQKPGKESFLRQILLSDLRWHLSGNKQKSGWSLNWKVEAFMIWF